MNATPAPNRHLRRVAAKANQCLSRRTKIPTGIRKTLEAATPGALKRHAEKRGLSIGTDGSVRPLDRPVGTAIESAVEA